MASSPLPFWNLSRTAWICQSQSKNTSAWHTALALVSGTSLFPFQANCDTGGLVILGLYEKGWSAATCTRKLQTLAEEAFYKPARLLVIVFFVFKWMHLFLFGHLYSGKGIETALQGVFGNKKMAAPSYATAIGAKIGILTASVNPPVTHLFTNYNAIGGTRTGYVVPQNCNNVRTWEM